MAKGDGHRKEKKKPKKAKKIAHQVLICPKKVYNIKVNPTETEDNKRFFISN